MGVDTPFYNRIGQQYNTGEEGASYKITVCLEMFKCTKNSIYCEIILSQNCYLFAYKERRVKRFTRQI